MRWCYVFLAIVLVLCVNTCPVSGDDKFFDALLFGCAHAKSKFSCYFEKAAMVMEHSMNKDIPLMVGVKLIRNKSKIKTAAPQPNVNGLRRFTTALFNFWKSHSVAFDLFGDDNPVEGRGKKGSGKPVYVQPVTHTHGIQTFEYSGHKGGGGGGLLNVFSKLKKGIGKGGGGKNIKSTFLVLLGIFGLTVPFTIKVLAMIAGKALLASNAAMLIVAGVALRKIFEHQEPKYVEEGPTIKVHTVPTYEPQEEEHDRLDYGYDYNYLTYAPYSPYQGYFSYVPTH